MKTKQFYVLRKQKEKSYRNQERRSVGVQSITYIENEGKNTKLLVLVGDCGIA